MTPCTTLTQRVRCHVRGLVRATHATSINKWVVMICTLYALALVVSTRIRDACAIASKVNLTGTATKIRYGESGVRWFTSTVIKIVCLSLAFPRFDAHPDKLAMIGNLGLQPPRDPFASL